MYNINFVKFMCNKNQWQIFRNSFNPLNAELNPICHLLSLLGAQHIFHISRLRVNMYFAI